MIENRRAGDFIERISIILVVGAFIGGFIVLLDVRFTFNVAGQVIQIGQGFAAEVKGMVLQSMLISGFAAVVGYWLGTTKQGQDQAVSVNKIAEAALPTQAVAVAAARAPVPDVPLPPIPPETDSPTAAPKEEIKP
ncbi:MAG: hypothetical protein NUV34_03330 [Sulfuricaulis sp.]|nr:hypothetical protein [Sulfuricaulis sp.]